ncbi:MAG: MMPL family transporter [Bradymonadia bacterium]
MGIIERITRNPWPSIVAALAVTLFSALGALNLQIFTARKALFPKDTPELVRLERFLTKFGAATDLIVVLDGGDRATRNAFAEELSMMLTADPRIRSATWKIDPDFFFDRLWLLLPQEVMASLAKALPQLEPLPKDHVTELMNFGMGKLPPLSEEQFDVLLQQAEAALKVTSLLGDPLRFVPDAERVEGALVGAATIWSRWLADETAPKTLDLGPLLEGVGAAQLVDGTFTSHDGTLSFIFVRPTDISEELTSLGPFVETTRNIVDRATASWHAADRGPPTTALTGMPAVVYEEFSTLQADVPKVAAIAGSLIVLLILGWLRSIRRAVAIFVPMGLGVVWSLGLVWLTVGHLTLLTSTFTAILFGLGVDYGIFMSARILEELARVDADDPEARRQAVVRGARASVRPLLVAGGATALIFCALIPSNFTGFAELGVVAASGVFLVMLATVWVQPALLILLPLKPTASSAEQSTAPAKTRPGLSRVLVLGALLTAGAGMYGALQVSFNHDLLTLLPKGSKAVEYQRRMTAESDYNAEVVIFTAPDLASARALEEKARALPVIAQVQGPSALLPADGAVRAATARQIGALAQALPKQVERWRLQLNVLHIKRLEALVAQLIPLFEGRPALSSALKTLRQSLANPRAQARSQMLFHAVRQRAVQEAHRVAAWTTAKAPTPDDLPPAIRDRFFAPDGTVALYAAPKYSVYDPDRLAELNRQIYTVSPEATGFPTTHKVFSAMVVEDFVGGSLLALVVALLWIIVVLRRLRPVVLAALPLVLGGIWMLGIFALTGLQFDFANVVALPLVMGLAVDYGVWLAHRITDHPEEGPWASARAAGRPILLAAATTLSGLGAVMTGQYAGMVGVGRSVTIGLTACVIAALVIAPAVAAVWRRPRQNPASASDSSSSTSH